MGDGSARRAEAGGEATAEADAAAEPHDSPPDGLGLRWRNVGGQKPSAGRELSNDGLVAALKRNKDSARPEGEREGAMLRFTAAEWAPFRITDLRGDDFVLVGDTFFTPVGSREPDGGGGKQAAEADAGRLAAVLSGFAPRRPLEETGFRSVIALMPLCRSICIL